MQQPAIPPRRIETLKEFYDLMAATRPVRQQAATALVEGRDPGPGAPASLANALDALNGVPTDDGKAVLAVGEDTIAADLGYEVGELEKDLVYLDQGEEGLLEALSSLEPELDEAVAAAEEKLRGLHFRTWITDRDGTTNNYCGRYNSSVQSAYNAVFLTRFAAARTQSPIFITSAPLEGPGIVDVSVNPEGRFIYAASKGREFLDLEGERRHYPIEAEKQAVLEDFNQRMERELARGDREVFTLIGSGFQKKFGQTTIARQDISGSVPPEESEAFLKRIEALVAEADPDGGTLRIEDTGLDVEVILTVEGEAGLKDFDKAEGVHFLDRSLGLDLTQGPNLISGDTRSDLPLVTAALSRSDDVWAVFVTRNDELADAVRSLTDRSVILPCPDALVVLANRLAARTDG